MEAQTEHVLLTPGQQQHHLYLGALTVLEAVCFVFSELPYWRPSWSLTMSPRALICLSALLFLHGAGSCSALTKTNLFLLETKALAVEAAPSTAPSLFLK